MFVSALLLSLAVQDTVVVASPPPKPERKICKAAANTGSRMGSARDCRTKAEWVAVQEKGADQRTINDSMNTGGYNSGPDGSAAPVMAGPRAR